MQFGFGSGLLYVTPASGVPIRFGAFQDMQLNFSGDVKELYGQNQFALDVARGKVKIEVKAKFAQISASLMNAVYFGGTITPGQTLSAYQEGAAVPGVTPFTVPVTNATKFVADMGVYDAATGDQMTAVATVPATGEYSVAAGVYTFAAADEGKAVLIDYSYTATTGFTMKSGNPLMGATPKFSASFTQQYEGNALTVVMPNCVASKFSLPTKLDDYVIEELDFQAFAGVGSPITISAAY